MNVFFFVFILVIKFLEDDWLSKRKRMDIERYFIVGKKKYNLGVVCLVVVI